MQSSRKLIILLVSLVLSAGLLFLFTQLSDAGDTNEEFDSDNPQFIRMRKGIQQLSADPWNITSYRALKNEITQAYQAQPVPLINGEEKDALMRFLISVYFEVVAKEAERFCRSESLQSKGVDTLLDELRNEFATSFQKERSDKIRSSLQLFKNADPLARNIQAYVTNSPFTSGQTSGYQSRIAKIKSDAWLSANSSVMAAVRNAQGDLSDHQNLGSSMEMLKEDGYKDCQFAFSGNASYRRFTYYYKLCKSANAETSN